MASTSTAVEAWKKERQALKIKRDSLFEKYTRHPHDLHMALEIKTMDDEIEEYTRKMEQENRRQK